jgi:hypothetical protein
MTGHDDGGYISPECFRAYVRAEVKVPNTLIAVSPYVGRAALASFQAGDDLEPAVTRFANTFAFSRSQIASVIKTVGLMHPKFGIPVLPAGADRKGQNGIRIFEHQRFEVVYMEGVMNILEATLRLHGVQGKPGSSRVAPITELLAHPDKLAATVAAFAAAEQAINSPAATSMSEAFKARFNFVRSGEKPRAMAPADKDGIQAEVMPLIVGAVGHAVAEGRWNIPSGQTDEFVRVLTSPELHAQAA